MKYLQFDKTPFRNPRSSIQFPVMEIKQMASLMFRPGNAFCKVKFLFIFSHMRSRSSLLSHILGSNPGICGYSELHKNYNGRVNLFALRGALSQEHGQSLQDKFLLDKLLFNREVSDAIIEEIKPKVVLLLRKPGDSMRSLIEMGRSTRIDWHRDPEAVSSYYNASMAWLQGYAERLRGNYFFIESDSLIDDTQGILGQLTDWLDLDERLTENYRIFKNSGKAWHGDPSPNIRTGFVRKTKKHTDIELPAPLLDQAELSYVICKDRLSRLTTHQKVG